MGKKLLSDLEKEVGVCLQSMFSFNAAASKATEKKETVDCPKNKLETRLTDLVKHYVPKYREYDEMEKKLYEASISVKERTYLYEVLNQLAKVVRKYLREMTSPYLEDDIFKKLQELTKETPFWLCSYSEFTENVVEDAVRPMAKIVPYAISSTNLERRKKTVKAGEEVLYLYCPTVWPDRVIIGRKIEAFKEKNYSLRYTGHALRNCFPCDLGWSIAFLVMLNAIKQKYSDVAKTDAYTDLIKKCQKRFLLNRNNCGEWILDSFDNIQFQKLSDTSVFVQCKQHELGKIKKLVSYIPVEDNLVFHYAVYNESFTLNDEITDVLQRILPSEEVDSIRLESLNGKYKGSNFVKDLTSALRRYPIAGKMPVVMEDIHTLFIYVAARTGDIGSLWDIFLNPGNSNPHGSTLPPAYADGTSSIYGILTELYLLTAHVCSREIRKNAELMKDNSELVRHAKAYETKQNISKKIQDKMDNTILNERFGFVEFDDSCDLDKITQIEAEIMEFLTTYFRDVDLKDVCLRFRRLGNHNALGKYWHFYGEDGTQAGCIAVDVHSPSSFVHELSHCIDHFYGDLSNCISSNGFKAVYNRYETLFNEAVENCKGGYGALRKEKIDYYLRESEVFARCSELYFGYILGVGTSIIRDDKGFRADIGYFPDDEILMKCITDYFSSLSMYPDVNMAVKPDGMASAS